MSAAEQPPTSDRGTVIQAVKWYLRSTADRDTHRGRLFSNGTVMAECGLAFTPRKALRNRGPALPGYPPDPDQVCLKCKESAGEQAGLRSAAVRASARVRATVKEFH